MGGQGRSEAAGAAERPACRWQRWSMVEEGKRGYRATTSAAAAASWVAKVREPPPRKRKPVAMLRATWLP